MLDYYTCAPGAKRQKDFSPKEKNEDNLCREQLWGAEETSSTSGKCFFKTMILSFV